MPGASPTTFMPWAEKKPPGGTPSMFQTKLSCPAALVVAASHPKLLTWLAPGPPVGGGVSCRPPTPAPVALRTVTVPE